MSSEMTRRDRLIPWYFVAFFAVVFAADAVMVTLALRTHTGTVTKHPYEEGLAYNRTLEAAAAQEAQQLTPKVAYENGALVVTLEGAENVIAEIRRPTDSRYDQTVTLTPDATRTYRATLDLPLRGQWEARVFITTKTGMVNRNLRWIVS